MKKVRSPRRRDRLPPSMRGMRAQRPEEVGSPRTKRRRIEARKRATIPSQPSGRPVVQAEPGPLSFPANPDEAAAQDEVNRQQATQRELHQPGRREREYSGLWEFSASPERWTKEERAAIEKINEFEDMQEIGRIKFQDPLWKQALKDWLMGKQTENEEKMRGEFKEWVATSIAERPALSDFEQMLSPSREPEPENENLRAMSRMPEDRTREGLARLAQREAELGIANADRPREGLADERAHIMADATSVRRRPTDVGRKSQLNRDQLGEAKKIVKKWMDRTIESGRYNTDSLHGLGRRLKTWMKEKYGLDEMPPGEEWNNIYWNEAKKFKMG